LDFIFIAIGHGKYFRPEWEGASWSGQSCKVRSIGFTALRQASCNGHGSIIDSLIRAGASVDIVVN